MLIADSQLHVWKEEAPDRPWVAGAREAMGPHGHMNSFSYQECLVEMDKAGVDRVVIVPPAWEGERIDYALEASEKHPDRFCVMARIPLERPEEAKAMLRDWQSIPAIKGTRLTFLRPQERGWMTDGTCDWYWPFAEEMGVTTMIHAAPWKAELGRIAARHPGLRIIVDHMGIVSGAVDGAISRSIAETAELHVHPNIFVKLSGAPAYSTQEYPYANIAPDIRGLVRRMGPERCFWGTDATRLLAPKSITYRQCVEQFTRHMGFTDAELDRIMGKGLCDCLGWAY